MLDFKKVWNISVIKLEIIVIMIPLNVFIFLYEYDFFLNCLLSVVFEDKKILKGKILAQKYGRLLDDEWWRGAVVFDIVFVIIGNYYHHYYDFYYHYHYQCVGMWRQDAGCLLTLCPMHLIATEVRGECTEAILPFCFI